MDIEIEENVENIKLDVLNKMSRKSKLLALEGEVYDDEYKNLLIKDILLDANISNKFITFLIHCKDEDVMSILFYIVDMYVDLSGGSNLNICAEKFVGDSRFKVYRESVYKELEIC